MKKNAQNKSVMHKREKNVENFFGGKAAKHFLNEVVRMTKPNIISSKSIIRIIRIWDIYIPIILSIPRLRGSEGVQRHVHPQVNENNSLLPAGWDEFFGNFPVPPFTILIYCSEKGFKKILDMMSRWFSKKYEYVLSKCSSKIDRYNVQIRHKKLQIWCVDMPLKVRGSLFR